MVGGSACVAKLKFLESQFQVAGAKGVQKFGLMVLGKSQEMCPVKTGNLRSTGYVKTDKNTLTEFYIRIGFSANYAAPVHDLPYHHDVGTMMYLATPFNLYGHYLIQEIESELKKVI